MCSCLGTPKPASPAQSLKRYTNENMLFVAKKWLDRDRVKLHRLLLCPVLKTSSVETSVGKSVVGTWNGSEIL